MRTLLCCVALLLVSACGSAPSVNSSDLEGSEWKLVEINGSPAIKNYEPTAYFSQGGVGGNTGLNKYSGAWKMDEGTLRAGPFQMTRAGGSEEQMAQESSFTELLSAGLIPQIGDDGMLRLVTAEGEAKMVFRRVR